MSARQRIARIIKRDGTVVPYDRNRITQAIFKATASVGAADLRLAETMARRVEAGLVAAYGSRVVPSVEDIQDLVENTLMANRLPRLARNYIIYRHHHAQLRARRQPAFLRTDTIPYRKIYEVLVWNMDRGCDSVPGLNEIIAAGRFGQLVADSERRFAGEVRAAAEEIVARRHEVRLIIVAGPSSSGKTTTTIKLRRFLARRGLRIRTLNVDNYFFDLDRHPRDEFGDYDYETPRALDLDLIDRHLAALLNRETVDTPRYDFKSGRRVLNAVRMRLNRDEVLLIDSLHGLYDRMTAGVPAGAKFRIYIETLGQLRSEKGAFMRWADNRLLRRMIRDHAHRNSSPMQTLTHWHYVRTSELKYIIPFVNTVDAVINTALPYEIPVLKHRLYRYFPAAMRRFKADPARRDAYIRARRVQRFLRPLRAVDGSDLVPATSLLREFIGGSGYGYE